MVVRDATRADHRTVRVLSFTVTVPRYAPSHELKTKPEKFSVAVNRALQVNTRIETREEGIT